MVKLSIETNTMEEIVGTPFDKQNEERTKATLIQELLTQTNSRPTNKHVV